MNGDAMSGWSTSIDRFGILTQLLYRLWFAKATGAPPTVASGMAAWNAGARPSLVASLRAAHAATRRFEPGWLTSAVGPRGAVTLERAGQRLDLLPPDYANLTRRGVPMRIGDAAAATGRRDVVDADGAWWTTFGRVGAAPIAPMVRVYWNCGPDAVTALVAAVTEVLEGRDVPYTMKCPADPALFDRVDGVVLYLGPEGFVAAKALLRHVHAGIADRLREVVPPLTLELGRGVAVAEDPATGESFGESRARAVADGLLRASDAGVTDDDDVLAVLVERLAAHGISQTRPYLGATSAPDVVTGW